jgi:hypothetical protein
VLRIVLFAACLLFHLLAATAQPEQPTAVDSKDHSQSLLALSEEQELDDLTRALAAARDEAKTLRNQIENTKDEAEKQQLKADLNKLNTQIDELVISLERVAAGSTDLEVFEEQPQEDFNWKQELEEVFEPLLVELKRLTERPRKIEQLRSDQALYEERLKVAEAAFESIAQFRAEAKRLEVKEELARLEKLWRKRREELRNKLKVTIIELRTLLAPSDESATNPLKTVRDFFSGRGLDVILALGAAGVSYFLLHGVHQLYVRRFIYSPKRRRLFAVRLLNLLFASLTSLIAIFAAMVVLSVRGDWLILGLLLLLLIGAVFGLRNFLPLYLKEMRILLNIGSVREGERIVYRGLPWEVATLNFYSKLVNPALSGGGLRLPLGELATLNSRPYSDDEGWFPTRKGDYVLLDDNTFGKILLQTPEYVQLAMLGAVRTYPVESFLAKNPCNLSVQGFGVMVTLGLDYRHQAEITTAIRDQVERYVGGKLQAHPLSAHLSNLIVDFNEAAASSLDIAIIGVFTGEAAGDYFPARRLLQRLAVEACNHFGWTIPFNQLSVHVETLSQQVARDESCRDNLPTRWGGRRQ